jgi:hypothetical protein
MRKRVLVAAALVVFVAGAGFATDWLAHRSPSPSPRANVLIRIVKNNEGAYGTLSYAAERVSGTWASRCPVYAACAIGRLPPAPRGPYPQVTTGSGVRFSTVGFPVGRVLLSAGSQPSYTGHPVPLADGVRTLEVPPGTYELIVTRGGANYTTINFPIRVVPA